MIDPTVLNAGKLASWHLTQESESDGRRPALEAARRVIVGMLVLAIQVATWAPAIQRVLDTAGGLILGAR